jgi:hypothetical protein
MTLQRKPAGGTAFDTVPPIVYEVLRSPGQPLDPATRAFFEPRFGHDFSKVRVHADTKAAESARAVNATAYTVGQDIAFESQHYAPNTTSGKRLLAHELAHVIQQGLGARISASLSIGRPDSVFEIEAEEAVRAIKSGSLYAPELRHGQTVARQTPSPAPAPGVTPPSPPPPTAAPQQLNAEEVAEAGFIALAKTLQAIGQAVEPFRTMYNRGEATISAKIAQMKKAGAAEAEIAKTASDMRKRLALEVREASGTLQKKAAELFDRVRGNVERPSYQTRRAAGKTDAQIIESATRTNKFINALPGGLRWTGRAMWVVSAGVSIYVVIKAPPGKKVEAAARETGGLVGGAVGAEIAEAACIVIGIATEGAGLLVCGLLGGLVGFEAGRELPAGMEKAAEGREATRKACESLPWYAKGACYYGASGGAPVGW